MKIAANNSGPKDTTVPRKAKPQKDHSEAITKS
jgi:hypothetical protein